jgi:hypothetical protein
MSEATCADMIAGSKVARFSRRCAAKPKCRQIWYGREGIAGVCLPNHRHANTQRAKARRRWPRDSCAPACSEESAVPKAPQLLNASRYRRAAAACGAFAANAASSADRTLLRMQRSWLDRARHQEWLDGPAREAGCARGAAPALIDSWPSSKSQFMDAGYTSRTAAGPGLCAIGSSAADAGIDI